MVLKIGSMDTLRRAQHRSYSTTLLCASCRGDAGFPDFFWVHAPLHWIVVNALCEDDTGCFGPALLVNGW